jgi:hypothetical protein
MRYQTPRLGKDGWSEWIRPVRKGYRMACCDCGLVHELDFRAIRWGRGRKVVFRARRNNRATAARRRAKA